MFRFRKISFITVIAAIVLGSMACDDENDENVDIQVIGDVFVVKRMLDEKTKYGHAYYLYGNYPLSSATVTTPDQESISLTAGDQYSLVFSKEPVTEDYTEIIPENGAFNFKAVHIDEEYQSIDNLDFVDMEIPDITSTEYLFSSESLKVNWNTVPEADSYILRLINVDQEVFFTGYLLNDEATSYEINQSSGNWLDLPAYNQQFVLELHASRYEEDTEDLETYHFEEISIAEQTIFWGVDQ